MEQYTILIVDDEEYIRETLKIILNSYGCKVYTAGDGQSAIDCVNEYLIDVLITDLRMPGMDGLQLMEEVKKIDSSLEVIFISAYADIKSAVKAMKMGAFDYIQKSFSKDELLVTIEKAIDRRKLVQENKILKNQLEKSYDWDGIIGKSYKVQRIFSMIDRIAASKATVLITGESGVGKEVFAQLIHKRSPRKDKEMVVVNCGAIPENLIESELFGHEKGAFTGAINTKIGKFEQADKGTIFFDEIGELPLPMQVKILRVLQERKVEKVGSLESNEVDIRVIAATNKDLLEEVKKGNFRDDLYYRLNVVNLNIPPLRERREDIPLLATKFMEEYSEGYGKKLKLIDIEILDILVNYKWPGNVRELKNVIERAVVLSESNDEVLKTEHLPIEIFNDVSKEYKGLKEGLTLKEYEKIIIANVLHKNGGNKVKTAYELGIQRQTLYNKIREYDIEN